MKIPFLRPHVVEIESYHAALEQMQAARIYSNFGPLNAKFECRLRDELFGGAGSVTTVANATLGLMLAIQASRRPGGKLALMPSFTFAATPLAAQWCGLEPYFLDVAVDNWCMEPSAIERAAQALGERVALVVACNTFGLGIDLEPYRRMIRGGIPVVVDAAAALGMSSGSPPWGSVFEGAIVYSLHATKTFAVGEGGVVYSASTQLVNAIREASNFGFAGGRESCRLGLNAKLSEFAAAVALATLAEFPTTTARRRAIVRMYLAGLEQRQWKARGWATQQAAAEPLPRQFFPVLAPEGFDNACLIASAAQAGVQLRKYFTPACHQQVQFRDCPRAALPVTEALSQRVLSLPLWDEMEPRHVAKVLDVLEASTAPARSGAAVGGV